MPFLARASLAAALVLPLVAVEPAAAKVFSPETFTLHNGLQVVVVTNRRAPVVKHMIWYRVGAADEAPGESGIAHFLEHLMFKGTDKLAPGEFSRIVARNGGRENAFTSYDYTAYHQTIAKDRLETVMEMEADRMTRLVITEKEVEPERQVVLEERRMRTDNQPSAILREQVAAAQFYNYPYRKPIIGWEHEIRALSLPRILDFYRRWYAPNNAILVLAGDVTAAEARPLVEKHYGPLKRMPEVARARPVEPPQTAAREITLKDGRVRQPTWSRLYIAPSSMEGDRERTYALEILSEILGGGANGRLYRAMVIDAPLAESVGTFYDAAMRGPATFGFYASPRRGTTLDDLQTAVAAAAARVLKDGVTEEEVARAKKRMQAQAVLARDSLDTAPQVLGRALAVGLAVDDIESWPERIGRVTVEQVNAAARHVLSQPAHVTARLLPKEQS